MLSKSVLREKWMIGISVEPAYWEMRRFISPADQPLSCDENHLVASVLEKITLLL